MSEGQLIHPERRALIQAVFDSYWSGDPFEGRVALSLPTIARNLGEPITRELLADLAAMIEEGLAEAANIVKGTSTWQCFVSRVLLDDADRTSRPAHALTALEQRRAEFMEVKRRIGKKIFERDGYRCRSCGATDRLTIDHIVPMEQGGPDDEDNLQTLCRSCNSRKGSTLRRS